MVIWQGETSVFEVTMSKFCGQSVRKEACWEAVLPSPVIEPFTLKIMKEWIQGAEWYQFMIFLQGQQLGCYSYSFIMWALTRRDLARLWLCYLLVIWVTSLILSWFTSKMKANNFLALNVCIFLKFKYVIQSQEYERVLLSIEEWMTQSYRMFYHSIW